MPLVSNEDTDTSISLKQALQETLNGILSPQSPVRQVAEERLRALEVTEDFGLHLVEMMVNPNEALNIRQLASVLLKQYVDVHWNTDSNGFENPEVPEKTKIKIKSMLPIGLREPVSKIRSGCAYAISAIAVSDWPEHWPNLLDIIMDLLQTNDSNAVHGAMRVLTEFSKDIPDLYIPQLAPVILPEMYKIFISQEQYSIHVRGKAVKIFCVLMEMIITMSQDDKDISRALLNPVLPTFVEALVHGLQIPDGNYSDIGLKIQILQALTNLVKLCPKTTVLPWLPNILEQVWQTLTFRANFYFKHLMDPLEELQNVTDSDGGSLTFENLIFSLFDFVDGLLDISKFKQAVKRGIDDLLYYLIIYMHMSDEQVFSWSNDIDLFIEDEDEESYSYSIRLSAQNLLLELCQEFPEESGPGLCKAVTRHLMESNILKESNDPRWWRIHEACFLALGSVRDLIIDQVLHNKLQFDAGNFLNNIVLSDLSSQGSGFYIKCKHNSLSASTFLVGRCLWIASRYCKIVDQSLLEHFLQTTVSGLQLQEPIILVSSIKAIWGFCVHFKESSQLSVLSPYLVTIVDGLCNLATQLSTEVLGLILETLCVALKVDEVFSASVEPKVVPMVSTIFLKFNHDPVLTQLCQDVFKVLSSNKLCLNTLQQRLVPTLITILESPSSKVPPGMQCLVLDLLETLVRSSISPLSDILMNSAFPSVVQCVLTTDDSGTLQNGGECIRAFVSVGPEQIAQFVDAHGNSGIYYVVQVALQLLNPLSSDHSAMFVGRLVPVIANKLGDKLGENLDQILKAVLSKLQRAGTLSIIQSLIMVYAHLINTNLHQVLDFLSMVPGPTGTSAFEFVLEKWCSRQTAFFGSYDTKVSIMALSKLLQHGVNSNDPRLQDMTMKEEHVDINAGVKTRSQKSSQESWTAVPLLVKLFKLLVYELGMCNELNSSHCKSDEEEWNEEEEDQDSSVYLSTLLQDAEYDSEDEEDYDALNDPIYQTDLEGYLKVFIGQFVQQPYYPSFQPHLTVQENAIITNLMQNK